MKSNGMAKSAAASSSCDAARKYLPTANGIMLAEISASQRSEKWLAVQKMASASAWRTYQRMAGSIGVWRQQ